MQKINLERSANNPTIREYPHQVSTALEGRTRPVSALQDTGVRKGPPRQTSTRVTRGSSQRDVVSPAVTSVLSVLRAGLDWVDSSTISIS
jgi:hypothetical protein